MKRPSFKKQKKKKKNLGIPWQSSRWDPCFHFQGYWFNPESGTRIPQAMRPSQKKKEKKNC